MSLKQIGDIPIKIDARGPAYHPRNVEELIMLDDEDVVGMNIVVTMDVAVDLARRIKKLEEKLL